MDYELVILVSKDYGKEVSEDVEKAVGDKKKITKTNDWGTKTLTYKILKQTEGAYFLFALNLEPSEVSPLDESLRRNENILRHLLVKAEKKQRAKGVERSIKIEKKKEIKPAVKKKVSKK